MTVVLTMELLVCFYWLLEMYVFVYCTEAHAKQRMEHFNYLAQMEVDCIEPVQESVPVISNVAKPVEFTVSELDHAAEGLFAELQQELNMMDNPLAIPQLESEFYFDDDSASEFTYEMVSLAEHEEEEDCIQLADLDEMEEESQTGYEEFASAKIGDCINGPQKWVVSIVGMEENYIHVSDGKRLWINVEEKASKLRNGDVLMLDVIRSGKEVTVDNLILLETNASADYVIPDESDYFYYEEQIAI
ncbi:hypothetical protein AWM68_17415 [Fictibacillus phosphorivorans]|uniref:Uncharacterized protein n=1 Tax=Fictibacillus phosphorivorans TaxID=1221500 RepID=A0A161TPJ9_9BACL|nr:hypothetical protein [Fictibacillus phosphorivorans]KZE67951.1 hypothetical protein AWM68_17415 [Fictibacillus phosphorivorans]